VLSWMLPLSYVQPVVIFAVPAAVGTTDASHTDSHLYWGIFVAAVLFCIFRTADWVLMHKLVNLENIIDEDEYAEKLHEDDRMGELDSCAQTDTNKLARNGRREAAGGETARVDGQSIIAS
jgi:hypothetical protein